MVQGHAFQLPPGGNATLSSCCCVKWQHQSLAFEVTMHRHGPRTTQRNAFHPGRHPSWQPRTLLAGRRSPGATLLYDGTAPWKFAFLAALPLGAAAAAPFMVARCDEDQIEQV